MSKIISCLDFKDPETGRIDFNAYHAELISRGDLCEACGATIINFYRIPGPRKCESCEAFDKRKTESVHHSKFVRCPACAKKIDGHEMILNFHGGPISETTSLLVTCPNCANDFEIEIHITLDFMSPKMVQEFQP